MNLTRLALIFLIQILATQSLYKTVSEGRCQQTLKTYLLNVLARIENEFEVNPLLMCLAAVS